MSRHRNVRSMNYEEDFYEDDDYLGHSVEDNYCISPGTAAQFTFNRGERNVNLASYVEEGIPEEDEEESDEDTVLNHSTGTPKLQLNETDQAKLNSCLDEVRNVLGESCPEYIMAQTIVKHNYNIQSTLNELLNQTGTDAPKPQRQPRESRRNRSQGDYDDDFDDFLQSLDTNSPKINFSHNLKQSLGILKYGSSWSSEGSLENISNIALKAKITNYSSAGSSECLSTTPDGHESGIRKRDKYPSTGSSDCLSCTPDEPSVIELANQNPLSTNLQSSVSKVTNQTTVSTKELAKQNISSRMQLTLSELTGQNVKCIGQPSLSELAKQKSSYSQQASLSQLAKQNTSLSQLASQNLSLKQPSLSQLANQKTSTKQPSLSEIAEPNLSKKLSLSELTNQNASSIQQPSVSKLTSQNTPSFKQPSLSTLASQKETSNLSKVNKTDNQYHVTELEGKLSGVEIGQNTLKGKLTDLTKMHSSGSGKQFSLAELAKDSSVQVRQPSLANLTNSKSIGVSRQPSLAELASSQSTATLKQPSLAELASPQFTGTPKQPSLAELANLKPNTAKQLSLSDLALPVKQLPSKPLIQSSDQPGTHVNSSSKSTDSQNSGKNITSLAAMSKPARSSSNEVKPSQGDNLVYNLGGLKISDLNKESNISLTDLAGKKIVKSCPKVTQPVKKEKKQFLAQESVEGHDLEVPLPTFSEETVYDVQCDFVKFQASFLGQVLCLYDCNYKLNKKRKYSQFSYIHQMKYIKRSCDIMNEIIPFDFTTPSPDDIVRSKQKAAFTRTGEKK
ncbi:uncharacterized protein LOC127733294 isoform X1 [Mytilus californianus]|uniref:uncharacterized protein LOC127733294 isoform X1 n=1 Tax=Mytilus californianus TaxID=6549 RepID=UPI002246B7A2|nr:uncharacterized protein LOC127733294 isoform X1 [Mytilus californianus]